MKDLLFVVLSSPAIIRFYLISRSSILSIAFGVLSFLLLSGFFLILASFTFLKHNIDGTGVLQMFHPREKPLIGLITHLHMNTTIIRLVLSCSQIPYHQN